MRSSDLVRFVGRLAYDGTAYLGFQRQEPGVPTIQRAVEIALTACAGYPVACIGAGRTDTGVHASGQVIAWKMDWQHSPYRLLRAINHHLPSDIALQAVGVVGDDFHPRFSAISRTYLYRIYTAPAHDPLRQRFVWHHYAQLDVEMMSQAAKLLEGLHDFATFGRPPQGTNTVRQVTLAQLQQVADEIQFTITADAFLQRMVRSIVGTLVDVGRGKMNVQEFRDILLAAERTRSGTTAPPQGLILTQVMYANDPFVAIIGDKLPKGK